MNNKLETITKLFEEKEIRVYGIAKKRINISVW